MTIWSSIYISVPHVRIQGSPDLHVDRGSTINLTCVISHSPEPPAYIFWYLNDEVMAYDSPRYKLPVETKMRFPLQNVKFLLLKFSTYCTKFYGKSCNSNHSEDWISGSTQSNIKKDFQFQRWDICCYWKWPRNSESSCYS